ncbi:MAG: helix-turn-helix domain-containing protein [Actinomycetota bacterium]|nr:helix-turn-helix domain-containing protein [Actinomycetota bacterium]
MTGPARPLRADAARNRARVLKVAYETFAAEGVGVPIDEIARRAGVGAGTVYRHFPTKEALFQAVFEDRIGDIVGAARSLLAADPATALFTFLREMVRAGAADQGLVDALAGHGVDIVAVAPRGEAQFMAALADLLEAAQRAGTARPDVSAREVKALLAVCKAGRGYDPEVTAGVWTVIEDGLRARG